ncbi:MAG: YitT family protein [Ruminococcus sp.]|nr:YitT family protein [Ruminococcus sp.]
MDINKILERILDKNRVFRLCLMLIGVFLLALNYNLFFVRYELVTGGTSGLAIVFNKLWGWNNQIFIYIVSIILLLISFKVLGYKETRPAIIGSILYPLFITFTYPLSNVLANYIVFDDFLITIVVTSLLYGFASVLVYKAGFNTGGSDIIMLIMVKYMHIPEGKATFISNLIIILFASLVLGINTAIYAIIIVYISSVLVDRMLIGISKSKLFIIETTKLKEVTDVIMDDLHLGVTVLKAEGGYSNKKRNILLCAVPTKDYYMFKEIILEIDKKAFFIINDCYDTYGGTMKNNKSSILDNLF